MPEYSGLKIGPFGNILVCPLIETHGYTNVIHRVLENNQSRNFTYKLFMYQTWREAIL